MIGAPVSSRRSVESRLGVSLNSYSRTPAALARDLTKHFPEYRVAFGKSPTGASIWVMSGHPYDPTAWIVDWTYSWTRDDGIDLPYVGQAFYSEHIIDGNHPQKVDWFEVTAGGASLSELPVLEETSEEGREWIRRIGSRSVAWWALMWQDGMVGWPSRDVMTAFLTHYPQLTHLIPFKVRIMVMNEEAW